MNIKGIFKKSGQQVSVGKSSKDAMDLFLEDQEPMRSQRLWASLRADHPELYKAIQTIADSVPELRPYARSETQFGLNGNNSENSIKLSYTPEKGSWDMHDYSWVTLGSDQEAAQSMLKKACNRGYIKLEDNGRGLAGETRLKVVRGDFDFAPLPEPEARADGAASKPVSAPALVVG